MDLNRVELIGHVVADPKPRVLPSGTSLVNLTLATSASTKRLPTGATYHTVVMFGKLADVAGKYVKKGDRIYVSGTLAVKKWKGKDGVQRSQTEITGQDLIMLGKTKRQPPTETEATNDDVVVEEIDTEENGEG